jgi:hypothetical protein
MTSYPHIYSHHIIFDSINKDVSKDVYRLILNIIINGCKDITIYKRCDNYKFNVKKRSVEDKDEKVVDLVTVMPDVGSYSLLHDILDGGMLRCFDLDNFIDVCIKKNIERFSFLIEVSNSIIGTINTNILKIMDDVNKLSLSNDMIRSCVKTRIDYEKMIKDLDFKDILILKNNNFIICESPLSFVINFDMMDGIINTVMRYIKNNKTLQNPFKNKDDIKETLSYEYDVDVLGLDSYKKITLIIETLWNKNCCNV